MNAKDFTDEFRGLMVRAMNGHEVPLHQMLIELDLAHQRTLMMLMNWEAQQAAAKIIPVNGHLPPSRQ